MIGRVLGISIMTQVWSRTREQEVVQTTRQINHRLSISRWRRTSKEPKTQMTSITISKIRRLTTASGFRSKCSQRHSTSRGAHQPGSFFHSSQPKSLKTSFKHQTIQTLQRYFKPQNTSSGSKSNSLKKKVSGCSQWSTKLGFRGRPRSSGNRGISRNRDNMCKEHLIWTIIKLR